MKKFKSITACVILSMSFITSAQASDIQSHTQANPHTISVATAPVALDLTKSSGKAVRLLPPKDVNIKVVREPIALPAGQKVSLRPKRTVIYHSETASRTKLILTGNDKASNMPNFFKS